MKFNNNQFGNMTQMFKESPFTHYDIEGHANLPVKRYRITAEGDRRITAENDRRITADSPQI